MADDTTITSRDNPRIKALRALATDPRELRRQGRTLLDGPHLVDAYRQRFGAPELLVVSEAGERHDEVRGILAGMPGVPRLHVRDGLFRELSGVTSPVGILAVVCIPVPSAGLQPGSCVLLDAVQDAGNVGTILRTAAAAGIRQVVLGPGCAGAWTPRVLRAAQGAHFGLDIHEAADLAAVAGNFAGRSAATVARGGESLYAVDLSGDVAWMFGNEGAGISPALAAAASLRVTIPLAAHSESLNVAAAAAVCLFEWRRQQLLAAGGQLE